MNLNQFRFCRKQKAVLVPVLDPVYQGLTYLPCVKGARDTEETAVNMSIFQALERSVLAYSLLEYKIMVQFFTYVATNFCNLLLRGPTIYVFSKRKY